MTALSTDKRPATQARAGGYAVTLGGIRKQFGSSVAVENLDLDVRPGEFLTLLGPSGCGKTTTLNMIAGFLTPDSGQIMLDGQDVHQLPPNRRDTAMVFQQYALFPHLTVGRNVGYGLQMRKRPKAEICKRVAEALERVGLAGHEDRLPSQLSGGQQQRVALARAIVVQPKVLLFDEPLSNLDLKLREQLRLEIKHLQRELGVTSIFVTHDQTEALVMSDRIAVMRAGRIDQLDTPDTIYREPANAFVAGFVGQSNLIPGICTEAGADRCTVQLPTSNIVHALHPGTVTAGDSVRVLLRPEALRLGEQSAATSITGQVAEVVNEGNIATVVVEITGDIRLRVAVSDPAALSLPVPGDTISVSVPPDAARALPAED
ncbi:ABC transporter ATP-binding protein [Streptomyces sp. NPDC001212]|uniref:ABC transporter ATP-binding protein n=1 Tax=Streptomyces sp. HYC2 TaxID=2955207 RepID=UPI0024817558|nr:ABC transporter ATP-binding protein [Streptomyces sp. HYC2]